MTQGDSAEGRFVVVLVPAQGGADAIAFLHACATGGLLGRAALTDTAIASEQGGDAPVMWDSEDLGSLATVSTALNERPVTEIAVLSLRSPGMLEHEFKQEDTALLSILDILPETLRSEVRSITVSAAIPESGAGEAPFSPMWNTHLICDGRSTPSPALQQSPLLDPTSVEAFLQALLAGLCAAGGWNGPSVGLPTSDHHDGGLMPVRFCHASMRVIFSTHKDSEGRSRFIPHTPPWPLPHGAGCEAAALNSVPPWETANQAATVLDFRCRQLPPGKKRKSRRLKLWRSLPVPDVQAPTERAMGVFLSRIQFNDFGLEGSGGDKEERMRRHCQAVMQDIGLEAVTRDLVRSGFKLPGGAAEASRPTPDTWNALYSTCLGLMDGGTLPDGITRPLGADDGRLVWLEALSLTPHENDTHPKPKEGSSNEPQDSEPPTESEPQHDISSVEPLSSSESKRAQRHKKFLDELNTVEPDELTEGLVGVGGDNDAFLPRLRQIFHLAVDKAVGGFTTHAFVRSDEKNRYAEARQTQLVARRVGGVALALVILVGLFAVDQRWPFVNAIWKWIFGAGSNAPLRLYGPSMVPVTPLIVCAVLGALGGLYLFISWRLFSRAAKRLETANEHRRANNEALLHYVAELLRLRTLERQFEDHEQVITRLLHLPFGEVTQDEIVERPDLMWFKDVPMPPGMLIGSAVPSDQISEYDQRQLKQVFSSNWLNEVLHTVRKDWEAGYQDRIVSGFEWPEEDSSENGTVKHRDRQTGEPVLGARTDWVDYAQRPDGLTAASREWLDNRMAAVARHDTASYASNLTDIKLHTGHIGWWETAQDLLDAQVEQHGFDLAELLSAAASTKAAAPASEDLQTVESPDGRLVGCFRWELHVTDAVLPQALKTWAPHTTQKRTSEYEDMEDQI